MALSTEKATGVNWVTDFIPTEERNSLENVSKMMKSPIPARTILSVRMRVGDGSLGRPAPLLREEVDRDHLD